MEETGEKQVPCVNESSSTTIAGIGNNSALQGVLLFSPVSGIHNGNIVYNASLTPELLQSLLLKFSPKNNQSENHTHTCCTEEKKTDTRRQYILETYRYSEPKLSINEVFSSNLTVYSDNGIAKCCNIDLKSKKLENSDFSYACFKGAFFNKSNLKGVNFTGTQLNLANITKAKGLTFDQLDKAIYDSLTAKDNKNKALYLEVLKSKKDFQNKTKDKQKESLEGFLSRRKNSNSMGDAIQRLSDEDFEQLNSLIEALIVETCVNATSEYKNG